PVVPRTPSRLSLSTTTRNLRLKKSWIHASAVASSSTLSIGKVGQSPAGHGNLWRTSSTLPTWSTNSIVPIPTSRTQTDPIHVPRLAELALEGGTNCHDPFPVPTLSSHHNPRVSLSYFRNVFYFCPCYHLALNLKRPWPLHVIPLAQ